MERQVIVRGEAEVRVMPDRATMRVLVEGDGSTRQEAYSAAARPAAAVDHVLETESDSLDRVTTAALVVQPKTRWEKGQAVRAGWTAYRASVLEVRALDRLGDLVAQLTSAGAEVSGLTWELDAANAAHDHARARAGEDSRRRAEQYAAALGVKLGVVAWIAEPGLRQAGNDHPQPIAFAATARSAAPAEGTIDVAPAEVTVAAQVEVGFAILDS
jgi:uncharacterized protein YggE